jgi:hypothetical protein
MAETLLLVGTGKGLFILKGSPGDEWSIDGPHFPGRAVYAAFLDQRQGRNVMWAGPVSWHFGAELCRSSDMGSTWDEPEERRIKMPEDTGANLENIWQITAGADNDTLYIGVAPAAMFESRDGGVTWSLNRGSGATRIASNGHLAAADFACTRSSLTVMNPTISRSPSRPAGCISQAMGVIVGGSRTLA